MSSEIDEPLGPTDAKRLIREILENGAVHFTQHAFDEMARDALEAQDCTNVLRGGVVEPAEPERGSWRYRVHTARMWFVIAFRSKAALTVITAWREKL